MVMFLAGAPAFFGYSMDKMCRALASAALVLLAGCATEPPSPPAGFVPEPRLPEFSRLAPYNKPYKVKGKTYTPLASAIGYKATGIASWYGGESGNRTASGARFRPRELTAAHKTLPIPSIVRVTHLKTGRSVNVLVNDRGPFESNRLIDLSQGAAERIGMRGMAEVSVEYIGEPVN